MWVRDGHVCSVEEVTMVVVRVGVVMVVVMVVVMLVVMWRERIVIGIMESVKDINEDAVILRHPKY